MSKDVIYGPTAWVEDQDTIDVRVTRVARHNAEEYPARERIRIVSTDVPGLTESTRSRLDVERALIGKVLRCEITGRDQAGHLSAHVSLVPEVVRERHVARRVG